jgi:hypothetical protein
VYGGGPGGLGETLTERRVRTNSDVTGGGVWRHTFGWGGLGGARGGLSSNVESGRFPTYRDGRWNIPTRTPVAALGPVAARSPVAALLKKTPPPLRRLRHRLRTLPKVYNPERGIRGVKGGPRGDLRNS